MAEKKSRDARKNIVKSKKYTIFYFNNKLLYF